MLDELVDWPRGDARGFRPLRMARRVVSDLRTDGRQIVEPDLMVVPSSGEI